jgi:uncharacterized protein (UPF0332 family)
MAKANRSLQTAALDLEDGDADASVNRSYYAVFYAAWALFESAGSNRPKSHSGMISEFSRQFVKEGRFDPALGRTFAKLENLRSYADYTLDATPAEKAETALAMARQFVDAIGDYLQENP